MGLFLFGEGTMNGMGENMAAKMEMHISVRGLVEFILRTGNIDNRKAVSPENAMQEGGRIHRMIQRRMGADYHAEVALKYFYETENYTVTVEGRADGIIFVCFGEIFKLLCEIWRCSIIPQQCRL